MRPLAVGFFVGLLLSAASIEAQVVTGNLIGVVRDESRAVLPGATVTVSSPALPGGPSTVVTNAQGEYRFTSLPPGIYQLAVTLTGFKTYIEKDLQVAVNGTVERNLGLPVATVEETITVSGQSPVVDTRQVGVAKSLPADVVEAIPHSRMGSPAAFMATLPGVTANNYNRIGGAYVMGSPERETAYLSDGILSNGVTGGAAYNYLDFDAIEDLNVVTLGASSEYQQAQGGVMNMVTKAGTNQFRADGMQYFAPAKLASSPIKLPCNCSLGETGFKQYKYVDFGYHAGGPIWKDHVWYFGGVSNAGPSYRNPGQPDQPKEYQWVRDEYRSNHKFTWKATRNINVSQVVYYEWWHWSNPDFPTFTRPLETVSWYTGDIKSGATEATIVLSPTTFLTARYTLNDTPYGDIPFGPNLAHDSTSLTAAAHNDLFTGVRSVSDTFADAIQSRRDDVSAKLNRYISGTRSSHNVRVGVQVARNRSFTQTVTPGGVVYQDQNGVPFQAEFTPPSSDASRYLAVGLWAENEMNFGGRLTITPGVRLDRMHATSPDAPVIDPTVSIGNGGLCRCVQSFPFTGQTVPGLGDLQTWTTIAPRVGFNYKLTEDGKTVVRGTVGRYYRPIFLSEFANLHPGIANTTLTSYNAATRTYSNIISVTDPNINLAVDPDMRAPYTNQYSIGIDRELATNIGMSVTYVHKDSKDNIGWKDIGGVYGTQTVTAPNGQPVTVFPLLNATSARKFLRTNGDGFFSRYNGIMFGLSRRLANRWTANVNYTYSATVALAPTGTTSRDPNDLVNLGGRDTSIDRPHIFNTSGSYEIPKVEVQVSGNLAVTSGRPYGAQFQVRLPQGQRNIYFEAPGAYYREANQWLHFRVQKILLRRGSHRIEAGAEIRNALQETSIDNLITSVYSSPNFGKPAQWATPRQLMFRVRAYY
jgi:hypothetical protein